jgi:hypothetical protein
MGPAPLLPKADVSPSWAPHKHSMKWTFSVWAIASASERNKFLALAEMENSLFISS